VWDSRAIPKGEGLVDLQVRDPEREGLAYAEKSECLVVMTRINVEI